MPNRVLIHLDPTSPPTALADLNATLRALVGQIQNSETVESSVRVCENFACGLPIRDVEELRKVLPAYSF